MRFLDLRQALADLGITDAEAQALGLRIYKVALTWPLFQIRYDASVAEHAWGEILGFFDRTL